MLQQQKEYNRTQTGINSPLPCCPPQARIDPGQYLREDEQISGGIQVKNQRVVRAQSLVIKLVRVIPGGKGSGDDGVSPRGQSR